MYALLNRLTREHPVAQGKIKSNNSETKYGVLAWYNLWRFHHENTDEHKTSCIRNAFKIQKCNMDQLSTRLDE